MVKPFISKGGGRMDILGYMEIVGYYFFYVFLFFLWWFIASVILEKILPKKKR